MALADLEEHDDRWELVRLPGRRLDRVELGISLRLFFDDAPGDEPVVSSWSTTIESPVTLETAGQAQVLDWSDAPSQVGPLLDLLRKTVSGATVWLDGRLEFQFDTGARFEVVPDPNYEAWQLGGPDGLLIVCLPGGGEPALWPGGKDQITYRP